MGEARGGVDGPGIYLSVGRLPQDQHEGSSSSGGSGLKTHDVIDRAEPQIVHSTNIPEMTVNVRGRGW